MKHADRSQARHRRPGAILAAIAVLALVYLATAVWQVLKPMPAGLDRAGPWRPASSVRFHADSTWLDADGKQHSQSRIFDAAFAMIGRAETVLVADFFLLNRFAGQPGADHRPLSGQLVDALLSAQRSHPALHAVLITDPFNDLYGGVQQPLLERLERGNVQVVITRLTALRDSNPAWSAAWRICCQWFGNGQQGGWLPNPVGTGSVTLRTWLALANFKANHRKTLVVAGKDGPEALVTSANPHDASSRHDNIAFAFDGPAVGDLLASERAVLRFSSEREAGSNTDGPALEFAPLPRVAAEIRVLTEAAIRDAALAMIDAARPGDALNLMMFYLSHREIVGALIDAHERGVKLRVLLDPNEDAFGRKKNGVPNRQVAWELHRAGISVRWCNTRGEQCHSKMLLLRPAAGPSLVLAGSANFTRRNLDNYNLETNVQLRLNSNARVMRAITAFFGEHWSNRPDRIHSLPYQHYADHSRLRYWQYRLMEATGLSTF